MTKTKTIPFAELRRLLKELGYKEKTTDKAHVFRCGRKDLLIYRLYRDQENLDQGDIVSTRKFLDWWGYLEESDFDSFLARTATTA